MARNLALNVLVGFARNCWRQGPLHYRGPHPAHWRSHSSASGPIIGRRAFNALPQEQKEGQNFMIQGNPFEFSVGSYKTRKRYGVKRITIDSKPVLKALRDWKTHLPLA
eukprot:COSAG06_NODE_1382_length_9623_cov_4.820559_1_plen_109_part_00